MWRFIHVLFLFMTFLSKIDAKRVSTISLKTCSDDEKTNCSVEGAARSAEREKFEEEIQLRFRQSLLNILGLTENDVKSNVKTSHGDFKPISPKFYPEIFQQAFQEKTNEHDGIIVAKLMDLAQRFITNNRTETLFKVNLSERLTSLHENGRGIRIKFVMLQFKTSKLGSKFNLFRISAYNESRGQLEILRPVGIIPDESENYDRIYLDKQMSYYDRPDSMRQIHDEAKYSIIHSVTDRIIAATCEIHYSWYQLPKRTKRHAEKCTNKSGCCRTSLIFSTEQLGLAHIIKYPSHFDIGRCIGNCPMVKGKFVRFDEKIPSVVNTIYGRGQCCSVTKLKKVKIVYFLEDESYFSEVDAGAEECGCVGTLYLDI